MLFLAIALHLATEAIWFLAYSRQVDMQVFRFAGVSLVRGAPLYEAGLNGQRDSLLFNYPPFAAAVFSPLALFPVDQLRLVVPFLNLAVLAAAIRRCLQALGIRGGWELRSLTMLGTGSLLWLEPVRTTIILGQINLVLLAIVVFDLLPSTTQRGWRGVGVGVAAGIKLTPLLFIPFLLLTGRVRAAAIAGGTFVATVAFGFAIAPSQAQRYWLRGTFDDVRRIGPINSTGNESLRGLVGRIGMSATTTTLVWVLAAALLAGASLAVAAFADRRGEDVLAVAICGLASAAVAPFAWGYHWVWFVPLAVVLGERAIVRGSRSSAILLGALWVATASWITGWRPPASGMMPPAGVMTLTSGGWPGLLTRNIYVVALVATLILTVARGRPIESRDGSAPVPA